MKNILMLLALLSLAGCGSAPNNAPPDLPPIDAPTADESVVRARAVYTITNDQEYAALKILRNAFMPMAYAATGATTVTYNNAASVHFTIDVSNLNGSTFTGDTLNLGNVALSGLDDNSLKVCGAGGNQKCGKAIIRVYTTGSVAGFVHPDGYGLPVYAGTLNPTSQVGLNQAGAVQVQVVNIASNKNRIKLVDFPTPSYPVTADFANGGSGTYTMNFVVEYALSL